MNTPNLKKLIDQRNQDAWDTVIQEYAMEVVFHENPEHGVFYENKMATIFIPRDTHSPDCFTHELLHLYLDVKKFRLSSFVVLLFKENKVISEVLPAELFHHISNVIDHTTMLPIYLSMGFERKLFLYDYDDYKCAEDRLIIVELGFQKNSLLWRTALDIFIGKYFAMKSCPNLSFDYSVDLSRLQNACPSLYALLEKFWSSVLSCNINSTEFDEYLEMAGSFKDDLYEWLIVHTPSTA